MANMRRDLFIALLLAGITFALYWPVRNFDLIKIDDPSFLMVNPEIRSGLNGHSLVWALRGVVAANWHPVTNLSFVLGHQFWGYNPGAEHLVNAMFHALNAALLFLVLTQMMGLRSDKGMGATTPQAQTPWRCAVAAALFAWHPLRVESVAWIAERKDVLSVFFFLLTLLCYTRAVTGGGWPAFAPLWRGKQVTEPGKAIRAPSSTLVTRHSSLFYWLAVIFFALGLMSKAMLVTLPFVLLLLDFWPLGRISECGVRSAELKTKPKPSTLNSLARRSAAKTAQLPGAAKRSEDGSTPWRGEAQRSRLNHLLLEKWPFFALTAVFSVITFIVQRQAAATPSLADLGLGLRLENVIVSYLRYLAWAVWPAHLGAFYSFPYDNHFYLALWPGWEIGAAALILILVSVLCVRLISRMPYLAVGWFWYLGTMVPVIGLVQVGSQGMADRYTYIPLIGPVISLVWLVAEKWPAKILPRSLLAVLTTVILAGCIFQTRYQLQFWKNSETLSQHTIDVTGENPRAEYILGLGLERKGDIRGAMVHYRNAITSQPTVMEAFYAIGRLLSQQGNWTDAAKTYSAMLANDSSDFAGHLGLAMILQHLGRNAEAATHLKAATQTCPDAPDALNNLAWTLATSEAAGLRDGAQAVKFAERACDLTHYQETIMVGTLAAAYAEAGRFDDAIATAQRACALASEHGEQELLKKNQELLELYRRHQPYRETVKP